MLAPPCNATGCRQRHCVQCANPLPDPCRPLAARLLQSMAWACAACTLVNAPDQGPGCAVCGAQRAKQEPQEALPPAHAAAGAPVVIDLVSDSDDDPQQSPAQQWRQQQQQARPRPMGAGGSKGRSPTPSEWDEWDDDEFEVQLSEPGTQAASLGTTRRQQAGSASVHKSAEQQRSGAAAAGSPPPNQPEQDQQQRGAHGPCGGSLPEVTAFQASAAAAAAAALQPAAPRPAASAASGSPEPAPHSDAASAGGTEQLGSKRRREEGEQQQPGKRQRATPAAQPHSSRSAGAVVARSPGQAADVRPSLAEKASRELRALRARQAGASPGKQRPASKLPRSPAQGWHLVAQPHTSPGEQLAGPSDVPGRPPVPSQLGTQQVPSALLPGTAGHRALLQGETVRQPVNPSLRLPPRHAPGVQPAGGPLAVAVTSDDEDQHCYRRPHRFRPGPQAWDQGLAALYYPVRPRCVSGHGWCSAEQNACTYHSTRPYTSTALCMAQAASMFLPQAAATQQPQPQQQQWEPLDAPPAGPAPAWVQRARSAQDITQAVLAAASRCPSMPPRQTWLQEQQRQQGAPPPVQGWLAFRVAAQLPGAAACRSGAEVLDLGAAAAAAGHRPGAAALPPLDLSQAAARLLAPPQQSRPPDLDDRSRRFFSQSGPALRRQLQQQLGPLLLSSGGGGRGGGRGQGRGRGGGRGQGRGRGSMPAAAPLPPSQLRQDPASARFAKEAALGREVGANKIRETVAVEGMKGVRWAVQTGKFEASAYVHGQLWMGTYSTLEAVSGAELAAGSWWLQLGCTYLRTRPCMLLPSMHAVLPPLHRRRPARWILRMHTSGCAMAAGRPNAPPSTCRTTATARWALAEKHA